MHFWQQFEESLIESLQSDSEIATCLNTYMEARKRVLEEVKSRGFWNPKGSKGKSKGKFKGVSRTSSGNRWHNGSWN